MQCVITKNYAQTRNIYYQNVFEDLGIRVNTYDSVKAGTLDVTVDNLLVFTTQLNPKDTYLLSAIPRYNTMFVICDNSYVDAKFLCTPDAVIERNAISLPTKLVDIGTADLTATKLNIYRTTFLGVNTIYLPESLLFVPQYRELLIKYLSSFDNSNSSIINNVSNIKKNYVDKSATHYNLLMNFSNYFSHILIYMAVIILILTVFNGIFRDFKNDKKFLFRRSYYHSIWLKVSSFLTTYRWINVYCSLLCAIVLMLLLIIATVHHIDLGSKLSMQSITTAFTNIDIKYLLFYLYILIAVFFFIALYLVDFVKVVDVAIGKTTKIRVNAALVLTIQCILILTSIIAIIFTDISTGSIFFALAAILELIPKNSFLITRAARYRLYVGLVLIPLALFGWTLANKPNITVYKKVTLMRDSFYLPTHVDLPKNVFSADYIIQSPKNDSLFADSYMIFNPYFSRIHNINPDNINFDLSTANYYVVNTDKKLTLLSLINSSKLRDVLKSSVPTSVFFVQDINQFSAESVNFKLFVDCKENPNNQDVSLVKNFSSVDGKILTDKKLLINYPGCTAEQVLKGFVQTFNLPISSKFFRNFDSIYELTGVKGSYLVADKNILGTYSFQYLPDISSRTILVDHVVNKKANDIYCISASTNKNATYDIKPVENTFDISKSINNLINIGALSTSFDLWSDSEHINIKQLQQ